MANEQAIILGAITAIILHTISIALLLRKETISYLLKLV
jgi:hypothetical protein